MPTKDEHRDAECIKRTVWYRMFGTPERAAQTLSEKELACTSSHVGVACFGLDNCSVCPFAQGLCGQASEEVDACDYDEVLAYLLSDKPDTTIREVAVDAS